MTELKTRNRTYIGADVARREGREQVMGKAVFAADVYQPGMLYGAVARSQRPHAHFAVDVGPAAAVTGVRAVLTAGDLPTVLCGHAVKDRPVLARSVVRHVGEPLAIIAADDPEAAAAAAAALAVTYTDLPAVLSTDAALAAAAPILHPDQARYHRSAPPGQTAEFFGNVCARTTLRCGDVEAGFAASDILFESTIRTQVMHQAYLEPHACVARMEGGHFTVWTATQNPFILRAELAEVLAVPQSDVRVISTFIGGAFGGKEDCNLEAWACLLSRATGRPVKFVYNRQEEFIATTPRHAITITIKSGATRDGRILARRCRVVVDAGAYIESGALVVSKAVNTVTGPYHIPHVDVEGLTVYTNNIRCGSMRGLGVPQATFAVETHMDELARRIGLDPVELRRRHVVRDGDTHPQGQVLGPIALDQTLEEAATVRDRWQAEARARSRPGLRHGVALVCAAYMTGRGAYAATIYLGTDGSATIGVGVTDVGQGSNTVFCQIAAEELGLPVDRFRVLMGDTALSPYGHMTAGSRLTNLLGGAVQAAARDMKSQIVAFAASLWGVDAADVQVEDGEVCHAGSPGHRIGLGPLAERYQRLRNDQLIGRGHTTAKVPKYDAERIKGSVQPAMPSPQYCTQVVEVAVDEETGLVRLVRVFHSQDVGRVINRLGLAGQVQGGVVMAQGYSLMEEMLLDPATGAVRNPSFLDYRLPTICDIPDELTFTFAEPGDPDGPFGAKGAGELVVIPTAAAVANAVRDACGVLVTALPLTPERVLTALEEAGRC